MSGKNLIITLVLILTAIFIAFPVFSKDNNITVNVGDTFKIELESNPTTGYQWQLAKLINKKIIDLVSSTYVPSNTASNIVGAGGKEIWTFKAVKKGKTKIYLKYVRSWENSPPVKQNVYNVEVKDSK